MNSQELIRKYLEDTIAAERNFEDVLASFAHAGEQNETKFFFNELSRKAKTQHKRLAARLQSLGGEPSALKSAAAHVLSFSTMLGQLGQYPQEKNTQHLIMTYAAAASEIAMYEALATVAGTAGDTETERLARQLQEEEKDDHRMVWARLKDSAVTAFATATQDARA